MKEIDLPLSAPIHRLASQVARKIVAFIAWQPFTLRGLASIGFATFLLGKYAFAESDLMAAILGQSLLVMTIVVAFFALFLRIRLSKNLSGELHFEPSEKLSGEQVPAGVSLQNSSVFPYFSLTVRRLFDQPGVISPVHIVKGRELSKRRQLVDTVYFPHRGIWSIRGLEVCLQDVLGLTKYSWTLPVRGEIEVSSPTIDIQPLPVIAASSQSGDELHHSRERSGDPFDIKAYDPSDGSKRILWKTFAKSGQLVVRRPEPAIVPEGEVAAYMIADRYADHVAGTLQSYLKQLHNHNIVVLFGTDGFSFDSPLVHTSSANQIPGNDPENKHSVSAPANPLFSSPASRKSFYCSDSREIQQAIDRSVWSQNAGTGLGFESYMTDLTNNAKQVHHVLVFAPEPQTTSTRAWQSDENIDWVRHISRVCAANQIKLSIALVPAELANPNTEIKATQSFELISFLKWLRTPSNWKPGVKPLPTAARRLAAEISNFGAELITVQPYR